jgi:hypothetical protein
VTRIIGGTQALRRLIELCALVMRRSACLREEGGSEPDTLRYRIVPDVKVNGASMRHPPDGLEVADVLEHMAAHFMEASGRLRSRPETLDAELADIAQKFAYYQVAVRAEDLDAIRDFHHGNVGQYSGKLRQAHRAVLTEQLPCTCSIDAYGKGTGQILSEAGCRYHDPAQVRRIREEESKKDRSTGES